MSTITAVIMVLLLLQPMLSACKKTGTTGAKQSPETHQKEMLNKSFEESKKVIAAKVNGEAITEFFVVREMNAIAPPYLKKGERTSSEFHAKIRMDALHTLITQELAVQEARKRGMKVGQEAIDNELKKIKDDAGSEAGYKDYLGSNGVTENELRKMIEQDRLFELIATQEIDAKITVTEETLRERYKKETSGLTDASHRQLTFEAAKGLLEQRVRAEAGEKRMRAWETELREKSRIEIIEQKLKQG